MVAFRQPVSVCLAAFLLAACAVEGPSDTGGATLNHLPSLGTVTVDGDAHEAGTLTATAQGWADEDGEAEQVRWRWLVNGKPVAGLKNNVIDGASFAKGDVVVAEATPFDAAGDGAPVSSAEVTIANTPPTVADVAINDGPFYTGSDISATATADDADETDTPLLSYTWLVNGVAVASAGATLSGTYFNKDDTVTVKVTASDGDDEGTPVTSNGVTILNSTPAATAAQLDAGPFGRGDTVTIASVSGWNDADGDSAGYQYAWLVNGTTEPGQTGATLAGVFEKGDIVQAVVTPYDGAAAGVAVYSNALTIANTPPTADVTLVGSPFYTDSTVNTSGVANDVDPADAPSLSYRWYVNGVAVAPVTSTLPGSEFAKGDTVTVAVTPYDGVESGTPVLSSAATIANSLPSATSADIGTGPYATNDTITVAAVAGWSDADSGDTEGYRYLWYKNGASLPTQTSTSLAGAQFSKNDVVFVRVTPFDGEGEGATIDSNSVTIANTPPVASAPSVSAGPYYTDSSITATGQATDDDGDTPTYDYRWYVNNVQVPGQTGATLTGADFSRGDAVRVEARAYDATAYSSYASTIVGVIANKAPDALGFTLLPAAVTAETATIYVNVTANAVDIDGDVVTVSYQWFKNNVDQGYPATQTTVSGPFTSGDVWKVVATADDGQGGSTASQQTTTVLFKAASIATGILQTCAITTTGALRCWGWNGSNQAGFTGGDVTVPRTLAWASDVSQVTGGENHTCALLTSGAVKCWGYRYQGRLGNNVDLASSTDVPQDVVGLGAGSGVVNIGAGYDHTCAVLNTGEVKCWGYNGYQQLGISNATQYALTPVASSGVTDAVSVSAGDSHTCAVRRNGRGVCWGYQYEGRLGNGSTANSFAVNQDIVGLTDIASISLGKDHACAVTSGGALYCWGMNTYNVLGNGGPASTSVPAPQQIIASGVATVGAGERATCAIKTNGDVYCWGGNYANAVGIVNYGAIPTPQQTSITGAVSLEGGYEYNCAVLTSGSVRCWGANYNYSLGNGNTSGSYLGVTPTGFVP